MNKSVYILALLFTSLQAYAQIYTYDANNKLTKVEYGNGVTVSYEYDVLGNRISKTMSGVTAQSFKVTVKASPKEYGSVDGGGTYSEGANVELNAVASVGFEFEKWSDGPTDNPRTITVTKDVSYTALFKVKEKNQEESGGEIGPGGVDLGIYDTNGDGVVNQYDLDAIIDAYLEDAPATPSTDLDDDGEITIADISMMVAMMNDMHTGEYNGHEYVDLGLPSGTLWATCNLGATSSEESGCYYAWGETTGSCEGKTDFSWRNYKYCNGLIGEGLTKYNNDPELGYEGYTDDLETLEPSDDAATANWGGKWRMPTRQEINELRNKKYTKWTFATHNGVKGFVVTSIVKGYVGNSIFLPAEGGKYDRTSLEYIGEYSYYWSSSAHLNSYGDYAKSIVLRATTGTHGDSFRFRYEGLSIRPVVNLGEIASGSDPDLSNGLVAYYPFNGNANDESGHGNHGILSGDNVPALTTDRQGNANCAYDFGGYYNYNWIRVPNSESLMFDKEMTISFWIQQNELAGMDGWGRYSTTGPGFTAICKAGDGNATYPGLFINTGIGEDGEGLQISTNNSNGNSHDHDTWNHNINYNKRDYNLGDWLHVALVVNNTDKRLYLDGKEVARDELNKEANFSSMNSQDLYIGIMAGGNMTYSMSFGAWYPFYGKIDDIRIYRRALCSSDIQSLYDELDFPGGNKSKCPVAEAIDLGLPSGTKWASWNIGASSPEDCGGYYAWGETEEKDYYDWSTYTHCDGTLETCHHIGDNIAGTEYDVARMKWGASWTMPSTDQIKELMDNCERTWTSQNGTNGLLFTGPNGNSIFLPAAGWRTYDDLIAKRENGDYWSSELNMHHEYCADGMGFDDVNNLGWTDSKLFHGGSVRAVTVSRKGESYAVYNAGVLTFYHDQLKGSREGTKFALNTDSNFPGWWYYDDITKVVFNKSFADARPTTTYAWFELGNLTTIENIEYLNTSEVTNMARMFEGSDITSLDLSGFNTGKVTNMHDMFDWCNKLISLDLSSFDTSNVTDMGFMFHFCTSLKSLDLSNFNTAKVTDMQRMFAACENLTYLDVSNFNTKQATRLDWMFQDCKSITSLNVSGFDTRNVTDMYAMFGGCENLASIDVSNFNTDKVTNMSTMFSGCEKLTSLDISNFNTAEVTNMCQMFVYCTSLTSLDVSNFNTEKVTDMQGMFWGCFNLTTLDLSNFDTRNVTDMSYMFYYCPSLGTLDVSNFNMASCEKSESMFAYSYGLFTLAVSSTMENLDESACEYVGYYEPCSIIVPEGFNFGGDTSGGTFTWKSGNFKLGGDNPSVSFIYCPDDHHPHAIDLGLPSGTKWACCNVDTTHPENQSPTSYGGYYAWGEIEEKDYYDWSNYTHCDGTWETCHYLGNDIAGTEYDVAHMKWGGTWRMPSANQCRELRDNCTGTWTRLNGINGMLVTGPNGNTIFLPAAGSPELVGLSGKYWASTPWDDTGSAILYIENDFWGVYGTNRPYGTSVRPICP